MKKEDLFEPKTSSNSPRKENTNNNDFQAYCYKSGS